MKPTIAVIGATGKMGAAISKSISKGGYRLLLKGNNKKALDKLVAKILENNQHADVESSDCQTDACWEADVIILAVPFEAGKEIAAQIKEFANQKVVISISNPLNETFNGFVTASDTSAAEELQKLLPNSKVIKAFNSTFAADFEAPILAGKQIDSFIAGNDDEALQTVSEVVSTAGFNPVIAGDLQVSRILENMQLLLIQLGIKNNYNWLAGWKILHN